MSKGGGSTTSVEIPEYIEKAAQRNLNKAEGISQIGYTPYYGPDVAALTRMQMAASRGLSDTAGAFGVAGGGMSDQDLRGGMPKPKEFAGGVSGYSSAPMFEESLAELGRQRPGQKDYIDSFFIDPFTGKAGSRVSAPVNYEDYMTSAESGRREAEANRQNDLNIAAMQRAPSSNMTEAEIMQLGDVIAPGSGYNPMTDTLSAEQQAYVNDPANVAARIDQEDINFSILGNANNNIIDGVSGMFNGEPTFDNPSSSGSYGGSLVTGGLSDDLPGNAISRALNIGAGKKDSSSDSGYVGSSGDGTVLCTAYCNMGYLPREIYKLDRRYGVSLYRNDPSLILGYRKWATPIAEFIKTDTLAAKATRAVMWPIVKAWAEQMAHEMKPEKYSRNIAGKAIMLVGVPFSRLVGAVFVDKSVSKEAA